MLLRKSIVFLVLVALLGLIAVGFAGAQEKIELEFWTFWGSETRRPIIEGIVANFNESQDRIHVTHVFNPWGDIWTKSLAAIAAGNPPDVVVTDINSVSHRAARNQATNLAPYVDADMADDYFDELWRVVLYEGDPYALPFTTDTRFLFYNKDHFAEVGLDPEQPPTTWAELEEFAQKLDVIHGNRVERIGFYPLFGNFGASTWLINGDNGVSWLDENNEPAINTPHKVETLEWINTWTERLGRHNVQAFQAEFGSQAADPFISGKVSMITTTGTFYTQLRDFGQGMNFGVAPVPEREPGSGHWSWGGGFVLEIPYGAKNPEAAYEFVKYATGPVAQQDWAVLNFDNVANIEGSLGAAQDARLSEEAQEVYAMAVENMEWTILTPVPLELAGYLDLVNPQIDAALLGRTPVQDALDRAQADVLEFIRRAQ